MLKKLILTEKPSVAKDIKAGIDEKFIAYDGYYESDSYIVTWAIGHLCELKEPKDYSPDWNDWNISKLPIFPKKFEYKVISEHERHFNTLKKLLHRVDVDTVIIATDPGREGELIARIILNESDCNKNLLRLWTSDALTPEVIRANIKNLKKAEEYDRIYYSALARQWADWLVGINCSRLITCKANSLFSVGRVQTATLKLIYDKEQQINNFRTTPYWQVSVVFSNNKEQFTAKWINLSQYEQTKLFDNNEDKNKSKLPNTAICNETDAKKILSDIKNKKGQVVVIKDELKEETPPLLFSLTSLQQEANRKFKFSSQMTLNIAQSLYEKHHAISYPRTDCQHLPTNYHKECKKILEELRDKLNVNTLMCEIDANNTNVFNDKKILDHHALIPSGVVPNINDLSPNEQKIYMLIVNRFLAAFCPNYKYKSQGITVRVDNHYFYASGISIVDRGWKYIYSVEEDDDENKKQLPLLKKHDVVTVMNGNIEKRQTTPPPRYTEATLLKDMNNAYRFVTDEGLKKILRETSGIGTAATRAGIIETLKKREYISVNKNYLYITEKGINLIKLLEKDIICRVDYTALWEDQLNQIAEGNIKLKDKFIEEAKEYIKNFIQSYQNKGELTMQNNNNHKTIGKCPACGGSVYEGSKHFYCSNRQVSSNGGCNFVIWKNSLEKLGKNTLSAAEIADALRGKTIDLKLVSKAGKEYSAKGVIDNDPKWGWKIKLLF